MFEASYLNGIEIRCCQHLRNNIVLICTEYKCNQNPFICHECKGLQKHYGHDLKLKQLIPAVNQLSDSISRSRKPIQKMYRQICADKQNDSFMKYQQEREQHCQSIRKHIQSIKFQIDEQIGNILKSFEIELEKSKEEMFRELEKYYDNYRDKFDYLSKKIGPIASINNIFKYYNKSNILLRLLSDSDSSSSIKWFNELKKTAKLGESLTSDPTSEIQKIRNLSNLTNQLMDKLPRVRGSEYQDQIGKYFASMSKEVLKQFVKFGQIKHWNSSTNLNSTSRSISVQGQKNQNPHHYLSAEHFHPHLNI